ncbi:hypothetical protein I6G46_07880 [Serratia plymuthica]|uniref:hypothetical protein n=1 Tax=Serratia plymuthica TaxID=82996 RepID=UPI0018D66F11|nr:hypothetical protein [Serratia plymuthica]QPS88868.1 hypothetical protein I6G46_07880 [Serratia plymuthica]
MLDVLSSGKITIDLQLIAIIVGVVVTLAAFYFRKGLSKVELFVSSNEVTSEVDVKSLQRKLDELVTIVEGAKDDGIVGLSESVQKLRARVSELELPGLDVNYKERIEGDIQSIVDSLLENNLENNDEINNKITNVIDGMISEKVALNVAEKDKIALEKDKNLISLMLNSKDDFDSLLRREYDYSLRYKGVVLNLFIIINIGLLFIALLYTLSIALSTSVINNGFPRELALTISGLYIGFASFVIYVIKFSNARILTIIALREDMSKENVLSHYVDAFSNKPELNENDVAVMRVLTVNRAQREQKTNHPYEVILQGISGSNIQFKGGRLQVGKDNNKSDRD